MNDQARWYEQENQAERVIANQGGPQYNSDGGPQHIGNGPQYNSNGGAQFSNNGGHQFNNPGGGRMYANTGNGSINIFDQIRDLYNGGKEALKHREYPQVVKRFSEFLSTAESANAYSDEENRVRGAMAHVYIVLGLLGGSRPSYHSSEVIRQIEAHLEGARQQGYGTAAVAVANVVLAIVKEDFYDERGIPTGPPEARDLRASLADVSPEDLRDLAEHMAAAEGQTWREMAALASSHGYSAHAVVDEQGPRVIAADRRTKVVKYFTKTPDQVSPALHVTLFGGAALLVIIGIATQSLFAIVFVAGAAWVAKKGYNQYKRYQKFRKEWEAAEPKPADSELDVWLSEDTADITRKGARKLQVRVDEDLSRSDLITPPIVVVGVPTPSDTRNGRLALRVGTDGQLRANHYDVLVLFLTRQVVSTYRCVLEFSTGDLLADETRQYHWGNIVGVSSVSTPASRKVEDLANLVLVGEGQKKKDISSMHQFTLSIVNGEHLEVTTRFGGESFVSSGGKIAWKGNDHAMSIIQSEVRARNAR